MLVLPEYVPRIQFRVTVVVGDGEVVVETEIDSGGVVARSVIDRDHDPANEVQFPSLAVPDGRTCWIFTTPPRRAGRTTRRLMRNSSSSSIVPFERTTNCSKTAFTIPSSTVKSRSSFVSERSIRSQDFSSKMMVRESTPTIGK